DELRLCDDVTLHRVEERLLGGFAQVAQARVERVELEEIAVASDGRTGASVTGATPVVRAFSRALWEPASLGDAVCVGRDVVHHPVNPRALGRRGIGRIGIVDDEREALRVRGDTSPRQGWCGVGAFAGVLGRYARRLAKGAGL